MLGYRIQNGTLKLSGNKIMIVEQVLKPRIKQTVKERGEVYIGGRGKDSVYDVESPAKQSNPTNVQTGTRDRATMTY